MMSLSCIKDKILSVQNIVITTHASPDGDAIGSEAALSLALKKLNKDVIIVNHDITPHSLKFLESYTEFYSPAHAKTMDKALVIMVDVNDLSKIGADARSYIENISNREMFFISHHKTKALEPGCSYMISESASSTGEIIYDLIKDELGIKLDLRTAEAVYTAIISDTKSFRYSRTTSRSHRIAAELLELGIDAERIQSEVFGSNSLGQLKTLGCMLQDIKMTKSGKVAYVYVPYTTLKEHDVCAAQTKGFVNHLLTIKGVEVAVLFRQDSDNKIKVSIRSKGNYPIEEFAINFGGGGHKFAATFYSNIGKDDLVEKITSGLEHIVSPK